MTSSATFRFGDGVLRACYEEASASPGPCSHSHHGGSAEILLLPPLLLGRLGLLRVTRLAAALLLVAIIIVAPSFGSLTLMIQSGMTI